MMTNLFSIFDPASSMSSYPLNWSVMSILFFILPFSYWTIPSRWLYIWMKMTSVVQNEMLPLLKKSSFHLCFLFTTLFVYLILNNSLGLYPYIFTAPSHLSVTLALSFPIWFSFFLYSWTKDMIKMLTHLVPQGTPPLLIPFMVLIETLSSLIRPFTLAIRLAANMIAGHLLLALMSSTISILNPVAATTIILTQMLLMLLEMAVAIIQAYVFTILMTLYISE